MAGDLLRSCDSGYMGSNGITPQLTQMQISADGGQTFGPALAMSVGGSGFFDLLARPSLGWIVIAPSTGDMGPSVTHDEGGTWQPLGLPGGG